MSKPASDTGNSSIGEKASSRRALVLMGILLALILGYISKPYWYKPISPAMPRTEPPPLPGKNSLFNLEVHLDPRGRWIATFDYFYTGEPVAASLETTLDTAEDMKLNDGRLGEKHEMVNLVEPAKRGAQRGELEIVHPPVTGEVTTIKVGVRLAGGNGGPVASQKSIS